MNVIFRALERTLQLRLTAFEPTREVAVYGLYASVLDWRRARRRRLLPTVGENLSADSDLRGSPSTWSSRWDNCRRNVESRENRYTSPSSIWRRPSHVNRRPLQDSGKDWLPSHTPEQHTVLPLRHEGSTSKEFDIRNGVKQGCVIAPTLFRIFHCDAQARFRNSNRRHLSPDKIRR